MHTCQSLVFASHTQPVIVSLRDNARRLCPRTELSEQYVFPCASQFQLVWKLQHFSKFLNLACVQHRVDVRFYGNAQQLFRLRAALEQYVFPLRFILSQYCDGKLSEACIDMLYLRLLHLQYFFVALRNSGPSKSPSIKYCVVSFRV